MVGVSWFLGIGITFVVLWLMVASTAIRYFVLVLAVIVGLGIGLRVAYARRLEMLPPRAIPSDQVQLTALRLASSNGSYRLSGSIENLSERYTLRDVHIEVTLYDCPPPAGNGKCVVLGRETSYSYVRVPPGRSREFDGYLGFGNVPRPAGRVMWGYRLKQVKASLEVRAWADPRAEGRP
jgi:hypothetical protein